MLSPVTSFLLCIKRMGRSRKSHKNKKLMRKLVTHSAAVMKFAFAFIVLLHLSSAGRNINKEIIMILEHLNQTIPPVSIMH